MSPIPASLTNFRMEPTTGLNAQKNSLKKKLRKKENFELVRPPRTLPFFWLWGPYGPPFDEMDPTGLKLTLGRPKRYRPLMGLGSGCPTYAGSFISIYL